MIKEEIGDRKGIVNTLTNIGDLHNKKGEKRRKGREGRREKKKGVRKINTYTDRNSNSNLHEQNFNLHAKFQFTLSDSNLQV